MRVNEDGELVADPLYSVLHMGTVSDREDPLKLGRVRLLVPGIYQVPSPWALPLSSLGGGSPQVGSFFVPEKGADVAVFFILGNFERPAYIPAHWGQGETSAYLSALETADVPNVRVIETKNFLIVFDDRDGADQQLLIKDKQNPTSVVRFNDGKVYLGYESADEPYVKGNQWKAGMEALFDAIVAITVPTGVGPSGPPVNSASFTTQKSQLLAKLSTIIFGK